MAWLLLGSIPGVLLGANMSIRVPDRALRVAFASILFLSGLKLVEVPHGNVVVATGAGVAIMLLVAWSLRRLGARRPAPAVD
jgi:hypothetical protein